MFHKDKNGAWCDENNMDSEVEVTFCSKDKGKKTCCRWSAFMVNYILACKSHIIFMELDFKADKLRIKTWIESNDGWTVTKIKLN